MAKTSKINRQLQRERMVAKYAERRAEYKRDSVNPHLTAEERAEAMRKLQALPRDASPHPSAQPRFHRRPPARLQPQVRPVTYQSA